MIVSINSDMFLRFADQSEVFGSKIRLRDNTRPGISRGHLKV